MARVHDMGEPGDFGSESAEVQSVECAMQEVTALSRFTEDDLFDELARRNRTVVLMLQRTGQDGAKFVYRGDRYSIDGMVEDFSRDRESRRV